MKIDYELVEKIGATHYANGIYYKADGALLCWSDGHWSDSTSGVNFILYKLKPIPPKPQVRVEYEKVTGSIFDLKDEFERGELYYNFGDDEWFTYKGEASFAIGFKEDNVFRRIEKPVDWRECVCDFLVKSGVTGEFSTQRNAISVDCTFSHEDFLEMCRVTLRANGEL